MTPAPELGLPEHVRACLFDLDGVLTSTTRQHAAAWKRTLDAFLREHARETGGLFAPFTRRDYERHVDGRPRFDGVRAFLASRGIALPEGDPADPSTARTVCGLGNRKNELVLELIRREGVEPYEGSVRYVRAARGEGLRCGVVSSSENCAEVLAAAGIDGLFDATVDGLVARRERLPGKPAPDTFLAGAGALGTPPAEAAVFEDALSGVEAGRAGGFAFVVGVDRAGQAEALRRRGADVVVADLSELLERA